MQIFLSYASEDRKLAEQIYLALIGGEHKVFFAEGDLPAGGDYHHKIRRAVEHSEVFVFLISPDSVAPGSYALTELKYARVKWEHPNGRVLPVIIRNTPLESVPPYLKAVTILQPEGSLSAEVLVAVSEMSQMKTSSSGMPDLLWKRQGSSSDSDIKRTHKITVPILVALIGLVGALGAAIITNLDKLACLR